MPEFVVSHTSINCDLLFDLQQCSILLFTVFIFFLNVMSEFLMSCSIFITIFHGNISEYNYCCVHPTEDRDDQYSVYWLFTMTSNTGYRGLYSTPIQPGKRSLQSKQNPHSLSSPTHTNNNTL